MLRERIVRAYQDQVFRPRWWSIFCNAFYLIRRGLNETVTRHAHLLSGAMLDLGCGNKPYRNVISVREYVGMDVLISGHAQDEKCPDVYYNGSKFPFRDSSFDSALCSEVLEHVFEIDAVLSELGRVLRPGASLMITVPFCWDQHEIPYDFGRYTEWGIRHLLERHGFRIEVQEKTSTHVEALTQLFAAYIYKAFPAGKVGKIVRAPVISAIFMVGMCASKVLPDSGQLYLNQVIVARRCGILRPLRNP